MSKLIQELERKIVGAFVDAALAAGHRLSVSLERGYDVDDMLIASRDREKIMAEAFAGDEAHIFIHAADGEPLENGRVNELGWVYIVLGNDGWDVISDYSANKLTEALLQGANALADQYA